MSKWITINEFCKLLHKNRSTYYRWVAKGLPTHKVQGSMMLDKDEVDEWIRKR